MKFFFLFVLLVTAGYYMQRDRLKPVERQANRVSESGSILYCAPAFDAFDLMAGQTPIQKRTEDLKSFDSLRSRKVQKKPGQQRAFKYSSNLHQPCVLVDEVQKELILLKEIASREWDKFDVSVDSLRIY